MREKLARSGGEVDAIYYCSHHPMMGQGEYKRVHDCRKPALGLIPQAIADYPIDLRASWLVRDKISDIGLGNRWGLRENLVLIGYGQEHSTNTLSIYPDTLLAPYVGRAVNLILRKARFD
jgi:D-glycero-D-manno-heptose 1,7-bisphosphate phosphatase